MGPYLGTPNTEKESENGGNESLRFGATSMQGWRKSQEDSHIAALDIADGVSIFGVFDGHGGKEVSLYVEKHFVNELTQLESFKSGNYEAALREAKPNPKHGQRKPDLHDGFGQRPSAGRQGAPHAPRQCRGHC